MCRTYRVKSYNNITGSTVKPANNKCPCDIACEGELGTACYKYSAGTGCAQSLLVCFLSSTTAADVSPGQRSHDPLLLSTTPSQPENKASVWLPRLPCSRFTGGNATPCRVRITLSYSSIAYILTERELRCRIQTVQSVKVCVCVWKAMRNFD